MNLKDAIGDYLNNVNKKVTKNSFKKKYPDYIESIEKFQIQYNLTFSETLYWIKNNLKEKPTCILNGPKCKHDVKFQNVKIGYSKYCSNCIYLSNEYKEKFKNSLLLKYGTDNPMKVSKIKEKVTKTNLKKYGTSCPLNNKNIKEKSIKTLNKHYGVDNPLKNKDIQEKVKNTNLEKYGTEVPIQNQLILERRKQNLISKYGTDNVMKVPKYQQLLSNNYQNSDRCKLKLKEITEYLNKYDLEIIEYTSAFAPITLKCKKCNTIFTASCYNQLQSKTLNPKTACKICNPNIGRGRSNQEDEILSIILKYKPDIKYEKNVRSIIKNNNGNACELDMYFPDLQLAIEYCGLIWHATKPTGLFGGGYEEDYHINKFKECFDKKIRLITLYEDEWMRFENRDNIKNRLSKFIGNCKIINGNDCDICEITKEEFEEYLNQNSYFNQLDFNEFYKLMFENDIVCVIGKNDDGVMLFEDNTLSFENYNFLSTKFGFDCLIYDNRWPINTFDSRIYKNQIGWAFDNSRMIHDCGYSIIDV